MIDIKLYKINYYDYDKDQLRLKEKLITDLFSDVSFSLRYECVMYLSTLLNTMNQAIVVIYTDDDLTFEPIVMYLTLLGIRIPDDYREYEGLIIKELLTWVKNANCVIVQSTTTEILNLIF